MQQKVDLVPTSLEYAACPSRSPRRGFRMVVGYILVVVALGAAVIWVVSYFSYDRVNVPLPVAHHVILGYGGGDMLIQLVTGNGLFVDSRFWHDHHSSRTDFGWAGGSLGGWADIGFSHQTMDFLVNMRGGRGFTTYTLHLPLWIGSLLGLILAPLCGAWPLGERHYRHRHK